MGGVILLGSVTGLNGGIGLTVRVIGDLERGGWKLVRISAVTCPIRAGTTLDLGRETERGICVRADDLMICGVLDKAGVVDRERGWLLRPAGTNTQHAQREHTAYIPVTDCLGSSTA